MCGIVGYIGQRDCTDVLMQGLEIVARRPIEEVPDPEISL